MYHEDQIQFYSCPLCGVGTGNDLDGTQEDEKHVCPEEEEWRREFPLKT